MRVQLRSAIPLFALSIACVPPSAGVTFEAGGFSSSGDGSSGGSGDSGGDSAAGSGTGSTGAVPTTSTGTTGSTTRSSSSTSSVSATAATTGVPTDTASDSSTGEPPLLEVTVVDWQFGTTTYSTGQEFAPRNITGVWILDGQGNYVTTLQMLSVEEHVHLVAWHAAYDPIPHNIDAVSGATSQNHGTLHSGSWDLTDAQGNPVPDGDYSLELEYTEENSASGNWPPGPRWSVPFTLGAGHFMQAPAGDGFFNGLSVSGHD